MFGKSHLLMTQDEMLKARGDDSTDKQFLVMVYEENITKENMKKWCFEHCSEGFYVSDYGKFVVFCNTPDAVLFRIAFKSFTV